MKSAIEVNMADVGEHLPHGGFVVDGRLLASGMAGVGLKPFPNYGAMNDDRQIQPGELAVVQFPGSEEVEVFICIPGTRGFRRAWHHHSNKPVGADIPVVAAHETRRVWGLAA